MKTTHIVLGLIAIGILAAAAWYLVLAAPTDRAENTEERSESVAGTFTGSIADLARRGGSHRCTLSSSTNGVSTDGVVYVSGEKVRGDFTSTIPQFGPVESHMLADGERVHTWTSVMPTGYSMLQTKAENTEEVAVGGQSVGVNQAYTYDCAPWSPEQERFELPSDITFTAI